MTIGKQDPCEIMQFQIFVYAAAFANVVHVSLEISFIFFFFFFLYLEQFLLTHNLTIQRDKSDSGRDLLSHCK